MAATTQVPLLARSLHTLACIKSAVNKRNVLKFAFKSRKKNQRIHLARIELATFSV